MAGEYSLKNGLQTDWTLHDSTWKKGVDRNWKIIDWSITKVVTEVVNLSTDIPSTPSDGDSFLVLTDNQVWVWNSHTTQFDKINLDNPFIFYDLNLGDWFSWVAGVVAVFSSGGGGGDVFGPASSVDERIAVFDGTTGKFIKDGGMTIADILALASGITGTGSANQVTVFSGASTVGGSDAFQFSGSTLTVGFAGIGPGEIDLRGNVSGLVSIGVAGTTATWALVLPSVAPSANQIFSQNSANSAGEWRSLVNSDITYAYGSGTITPTIANDAVTFAKFQNITTNKLLGRATAGTGDMEEITLGTGLSYTGTTLNVSGFSPSTLTQNHIFVGNASNVATDVAMSGDATIVASGAITLASIIPSAGPIGSATVTPIITYDAKGRLTTVTSATITPAASSITGGQTLSKTDDTNVTLTLGGSPLTALLAATSLTLGWTGQLSGARGGTGVNNSGKTITLAGSLTLSGAFDLTLTQTGTTNVTLPTTGTLATLAGSETLSNKTLGNSNIVTLRDDRFTLQDDSDNTKQAVFQLSSIATGTTRTYTLPDATGTVQLIAATQTVSNKTYDNSNIFTIRDDRLTIQDNSDNTKQGVFELSGITTGTTRTLTWPNVNGTILTSGDSNTVTDAILRQSEGLSVIGRSANSTGNVADITAGTDLHVLRRSGTSIGFGLLTAGSNTGAAYTMFANITNASAAYTEVVAKPVASQTYSGTITWTGTTAPSGSTNHTYQWQQCLKWVVLNISLVYGTAGSALSQVIMTLPTDCPNPVEPTGLGASTEKLYPCTGWIDSAKTGSPPASRGWMRVNSGDTGYELVVVVASNNATVANITVWYPTA